MHGNASLIDLLFSAISDSPRKFRIGDYLGFDLLMGSLSTKSMLFGFGLQGGLQASYQIESTTMVGMRAYGDLQTIMYPDDMGNALMSLTLMGRAGNLYADLDAGFGAEGKKVGASLRHYFGETNSTYIGIGEHWWQHDYGILSGTTGTQGRIDDFYSTDIYYGGSF
jgi:hypothetical protein